MKRKYSEGTKNNVSFFIGEEIEHTKFYGMQTLFVVGIHRTAKIINLANKHNIKHIYLGANHSEFSSVQAEDLLDLGYYVTVDSEHDNAVHIDHDNYQLIIRYPLKERMIKINTHLKFFDDDLNRKGIYVIPSNILKNEEHYTDNTEYGNDIIINED